MKLDRETYEAWLLDRMEGRLSPAQVSELDAFLRANPDLPASMSELPRLHSGDLEFPMKGALRKDHPPTGSPDAARLDDFLVARSEKKLSAEQEKELDRFLYEHPAAERQAALMALAHVPKDTIIFPAKSTVERHFPPKGMPDVHHLTDFLIASLEGDLSTDQRSALKQYLNGHPEAVHEKRLVTATRIMPVAVRFTGKEGLKKREVRVLTLWPRLAAAACFVLLLGAGWWLLHERTEEVPAIARIEMPTVHEEVRAAGHGPQPVAPEQPDATERHGVAQALKPAPVESPAEGSGSTRINATPYAPKSAPLPGEKPERRDAPAAKPITNDLPVEEPELAHQMEKPASVAAASQPVVEAAPPKEMKEVSPSAQWDGSNQDLAEYVANTIRGKVLETPKRTAVLDRSDALAFADKAISTVTGGQGGVEVQHNSAGQRFQLRLGRNFSVSASRQH